MHPPVQTNGPIVQGKKLISLKYQQNVNHLS